MFKVVVRIRGNLQSLLLVKVGLFCLQIRGVSLGADSSRFFLVDLRGARCMGPRRGELRLPLGT